jgi:hypothetical protein
MVTKKCPVYVQVGEFLDALREGMDSGFGIEIIRSSRNSKYFLLHHQEKPCFYPTTVSINIHGKRLKSGWIRVRGYLNDNHEKPCDLEFTARTGKGFIWSRF